ncbi:MAG TPA: NUDIX hydrolase [Jatrophihabitans sp.]|jgi:hypothetical protein
MLPVGWLVVAVVVAILLSMWVTFTLTRLDRLHARVDAARAALDAQLVRRAAALLYVAESPLAPLADGERADYQQIAVAGTTVDGGARREPIENAIGRAVTRLVASTQLRPEAAEELREAAARVQVARRFYNDAVRDTRSLRARRMPRALHLAGRVPLPQFFDIDDTEPAP